MKKIFISACMAALALLTGCQQDNEWVNDNATAEGRKVTLTAHLPGDGHSRVALEAGKDDDNNPIVKASWNDSDETFEVYTENSTSPITFTQVGGNQFEGTGGSGTPEGPCTAYYPVKDYDISTQDGTLNQGTFVLMEAAVTDFVSPIKFEHKTAILQPAFKMSGGSDIVDNSSITQIVVHNVKKPKAADTTVKSLTVTPKQLNDIYLFLPAHENYEAGYAFSFEVTVGGQNGDTKYFGTLALATGTSIEAGKLYTATIELNQNQYPYVTFTASGEQTLSYKGTDLEYSTDGVDWKPFTGSESVTFGGETKLYLRGDGNTDGTATNTSSYSQISFGDNNIPVACTGDIRTLLDYDSYATVNTDGAKFCYLFLNCKVLTSAPALPATDLAETCYNNMFNGCSALTTAPALPAKTLAEKCYYSMFSSCSALTTAPALPATTLAKSCYYSMFSGCTSLETAPELPATTLAASCYYNMFFNCKALKTAPELKATTLAESCYYSMFSNCSALTTAPELPATTLAKECYDNMFYQCTSLETAPALPATTLADNCYSYMFQGCKALETAPELKATTLAKECYSYMFSSCKALTTAPALPATTLAESCYENMFQSCSALTTAPELNATDLAKSCYYYMFSNCTSLKTAPALPATTLAESCYRCMFNGCTSLTSAPVLPATTLAASCYYRMFYGCTSLSSVTMLATDINANGCLTDWLQYVATSGTFTKAASMEALPSGASGIPNGWSVESYSQP